MFREVPAEFDFPAMERSVLDFWEANRVYEQSLARRREENDTRRERGEPERIFVFYEGPPTANGLPHPGHCLTRAIKDLFPRYRTMCGDYCERKAGWDTHGLPVEVEVCKELGIHGKDEIERFGVEKFNRRCLESVFRYTREWEAVTRRLGFWVNLDEAYVTYHQEYVESVWWALKTLFKRGLLYQGHKVVWWWAQGGTALSAGEVGQGYREVDDPSVYVRFPLVMDDCTRKWMADRGLPIADFEKAKISLLVWTTTPWTLISNTFAAVHREFEYAVAYDAQANERLILAADLVGSIARKVKREWVVEKRVKGADLLGLRYVPPFDCYYRSMGAARAALRAGGEEPVAWRIVAADFVTLESGTGAVHEAPAFGEVDFDLLMQERERFTDSSAVPLLCAVGPDGRFTAEAGDKYAGRWVKEADKDIIRDLKERGLLLHQELYRHEYPFCWRAEEDPLIQYPRRSWFVRTTRFRDAMLENNRAINWLPDHIRDGRFGKFLESNVDWALSRERFWGTPLPIWVCDGCGHTEAVASYSELLGKPGVQGTEVWQQAKRAEPDLSDHLKIHKPYIDAVRYACANCAPAAGRMKRVPDVIDCWFDAGCMPFAQWGFPHAPGSIDKFTTTLPADFISEALDQTRGWFYAMLAISTLLFNEKQANPHPFRNCIVLGLIQGEDGQKLSKSKRNYKEPGYIFDREGADAMRWYFFAAQAPWTTTRFGEQAIADSQRDFLIRLYNVYSFFVIYANIDGWTPAEPPAAAGAALIELDRWILSELHRTIRDVRSRMDAYENFPAAGRLIDFVDALSNWYVRRSRDRYWAEGLSADKRAAYETLYECLLTTTKLIAPFVPFFAESLYQNLARSEGQPRESAQPITPPFFPLDKGEAEGGAPVAKGEVRGGSSVAKERRGGGALLSVHLCDYPLADEGRIDWGLIERMGKLREVVSLGRAARAEARLRVRQPLAKVEIVLAEQTDATWMGGDYSRLIQEELNVKTVEFVGEADQYVEYRLAPNFKSIGPKFGPLAPRIKQALASADAAALRRLLEVDGRITLTVDGRAVELSPDDVQIGLVARAGWTAAQGRSAVVVLSTELTDALRDEGLARELVHHVQQLRKKAALRYEQRINLAVSGDETVRRVLADFGDYLRGETLAAALSADPIPGVPPAEFDIEGHPVRVWLRPT